MVFKVLLLFRNS